MTVGFGEVRGPITVVSLWAVYCGSCSAKLPAVNRLAEHYRDDADVRVITVSIDEPERQTAARELADELAGAATAYLAPEPEMILPWLRSDEHGQRRVVVPTTIVIGSNDTLHFSRVEESGEEAFVSHHIALVEQARRGELEPRQEVISKAAQMKVQFVDDSLVVEMIYGGRWRQEMIDFIVLFGGELGMNEAATRGEVEAQFGAGATTVRLALPEAAPESKGKG